MGRGKVGNINRVDSMTIW